MFRSFITVMFLLAVADQKGEIGRIANGYGWKAVAEALIVRKTITPVDLEHAEALGIRVSPFVSGEVQEVWEAWKNGHLDEACYSMPGCRRCRRRKGECN